MHDDTDGDALFYPAPFFMVRTAILPIGEFFDLAKKNGNEEDLLSCYLREKILIEAIAIASPSLHAALQKIEGKNKRERKQIFSSLLKYISRMCTRSTPFGLFATVSQGKWGDETAIHLDHKKVIKRARPDMEWLMAVLNAISESPEYFDILPIQSNPLLYYTNNRFLLNDTRPKEGDKEQNTVSVMASPLVITILNISQQPVTVNQLLNKIVEQMPALEREKVREVIWRLFEQQILISSLRPSLLTTSPFQDLLSKLDAIQQRIEVSTPNIPEITKLHEINEQITNYNLQGIGQNVTALEDIQSTMRKVAPSNYFLQVDSAYLSEDLSLNKTVSEELKKATEILWLLTFRENQHLKHIHAKFNQKYGLARKIPLLDLLCDEGLGIAGIYSDSSFPETPACEKEKAWIKWLKRKWCACLHERKQEICLTEELVNKVLRPGKKEKAPLSFDLYCEIIAESSMHINNGDFLVNIVNNNWQGGSTFGRFIDILGLRTKESLQQIYSHEESLEENVLFAESSYLPFPSRYANVTITCPHLRKYAIDLENNSSPNGIPLSDILVGATEDRFYLSLKGKNEELVATSSNLLNLKGAPLPIRFIRDVSSSRYSFFDIFMLKEFDNVPFMPRIKYNRSILSSAQWRVDLDQIEASSKDGEDKIGEKLLKWAATWSLPRYVFIKQADNRILLDCQNTSHLHEIISVLKKNAEVKLVEKIGQEKGEWVTSSKGHHYTEFVIPFIKNKKFQHPSYHLQVLQQDPPFSINRWKLPGSDWLFIKLYLAQDKEAKFLHQHLSPFANHLQERELIDGWFYIRYADHSPHIRVRFHGDKEKMLSSLMPALHDWFLFLLQHQILHDLGIGCYERELERYGGEEVIEVAESFFCADSSTAIALLNLMAEKKLSLPDYAIAALSLIDLLSGLEMNLQEKMSFLKSFVTDQRELKGFRYIKSHLLTLLKPILEPIQGELETTLLIDAFKIRKEALKVYKDKILQQYQQKSLSTPLSLIYNSLLHVHCNRLLGCQLNLEKKAYLYAYHTLLCYWNQQEK